MGKYKFVQYGKKACTMYMCYKKTYIWYRWKPFVVFDMFPFSLVWFLGGRPSAPAFQTSLVGPISFRIETLWFDWLVESQSFNSKEEIKKHLEAMKAIWNKNIMEVVNLIYIFLYPLVDPRFSICFIMFCLVHGCQPYDWLINVIFNIR